MAGFSKLIHKNQESRGTVCKPDYSFFFYVQREEYLAKNLWSVICVSLVTGQPGRWRIILNFKYLVTFSLHIYRTTVVQMSRLLGYNIWGNANPTLRITLLVRSSTKEDTLCAEVCLVILEKKKYSLLRCRESAIFFFYTSYPREEFYEPSIMLFF